MRKLVLVFIFLVTFIGNCYNYMKPFIYDKDTPLVLLLDQLLRVPKIAPVSGTIRDETWKSLSNHILTFEPIGITTTTDENGTYKVNLPIGTYTVTVRNETGIIGTFTLTVTEDGSISISVLSSGLIVIANENIGLPNKVATPVFTPSIGIYNSDQGVVITTATQDAVIYYTTDGTNPTTDSSIYTSPISIAGHGTSVTIKAIAVKSGMIDSNIASGTWTINYTTVSTPKFSITAGAYNIDQTVSITTNTLGATIYYTTDGTNPTTSSAIYTSPILIAGHGTSVTIKAMAVKSGMLNSNIASGTWTISYNQVAIPTFSISQGTYTSDQLVGISTNTLGATIYYTTDGTNPTTSSAIYTSPILIAGHGTSVTIKAMAVKTGMAQSSIASGTWTIQYFPVATPIFSPSDGVYTSDQAVSISVITPGATIHYTLDGTNPTTSSAIYTSPILIAGHGTSVTIKAMAVKTGMEQSGIASGTWNIIYPYVATPIFTPSPGHYSSPQYITIATGTSGATIHYTLDGTNPTTSSPIYTSPIHIWSVAGRVIKAMAVKSGMANSAIASGTFSYPPLKTGQNLCWDINGNLISCVGTGHDGDLKMGLSRNYTDNGNGTVTDNTTGLVWQKCSRGQNNDSTCSGTLLGANYNDGINYCNGLTLAGRTWRLPTREEIETLQDFGILTPIIINLTYFPNHPSSLKSSTPYSVATDAAWDVTFWSGTLYHPHIFDGTAIRCVSGIEKKYVGNFTDNGDGTVRHNATGLVWQKCTRGQNNDFNCSGTASPTNWQNAINYCNTLSLASRVWRLPNLNELKTITDTLKTTSPTIDSVAFPNTISNVYWTSTSGSVDAGYTIYAWQVDFLDANAFMYANSYRFDSVLKTNNAYVRCVSGP